MGNCVDFIEPQLRLVGDLVRAGPESFYTYDSGRDSYWYTLRDLDGKELRRFGESTDFVNFLSRMRGVSQLALGPDRTLIAGLPAFSAPIAFDSTGEALGPLFEPPSYVRPMTEDMRDTRGGQTGSLMEEMQKVSADKTQLLGVYRISSNTTLVRYRNNYREITDVDAFGLHVVRDDGRILTPQPIHYSRGHAPDYAGFSLYAVKDNLLFMLRPAEQQPDGDWGNPGLVVWRFTTAAP